MLVKARSRLEEVFAKFLEGECREQQRTFGMFWQPKQFSAMVVLFLMNI